METRAGEGAAKAMEAAHALDAARAEAAKARALGKPDSPGPHRLVAVPPRADPEFPVKDWDRYEFLRFLGQGGMGMVFLARDRRLGREVAIKFVRKEKLQHRDRFMQEARAQAQVEHEHVCKVFEVGEAGGEVYIAMQPLRGRTLDELAPALSLEQKVLTLRDAALGVHAAHRVGIIHRDLKPQNIHVEVAENGALHTYVMDFGLAREGNECLTETSSVMGTPAYMSPEQARGDVRGMDRRSDVYSLGATLYQVATGKAPVSGTNALEILNAVTASDIQPLRAHSHDIPKDLEAITLKCLEKDRARRYDSAKALAEDLDRFLAGDPVQARPTGFWYKVQRRLLKHRQLTVVGAAALAVVLVALGAALRTRRDAGRRERLARQFTEAMARIDSMARYSALSPPHDIRPDLQAVREQMAQLQLDMKQAGALAKGPGHYALGRGYWTLDDPEQAREHLQMAWDAGYREPRVAYALALVLGQQYRDKLLEAQRITSKDQREARLREVERTLRNPALAFLKQAQGADVPSPAYLEALLAFFEGRLDEALAKLKTLGSVQPWFFEAPLLRGSLLQARAWNKRNQGDMDGAHRDFAEGREAMQAAAATGRSAPAVYAALGDLELNAFLMEKYGQGDVMAPFMRGAQALETALNIQPDHAPSLILQAALTGELAEAKASKGEDAEDLGLKAVQAASLAVKGSPTRADARVALGKAYLMLGNARLRRDQDPREAFQRGLEAFGALSNEKRDYSAWNHLGILNRSFAQFESSHGQDSSAHLSAAIECFSTATRMEPHLLPGWMNLGSCLEQRAGLPKAVDPSKDLEAALQALEHARTLNSKHFVPYFMLGRVHYAMALRARGKGEDPTPALQRSRGWYHQGLSINPQSPHLHNGKGVALSELARESWARGEDPGKWISEAKESYRAAIQVAPAQSNGYINLSDMLINESRWLASEHSIEEAESVVQRGRKAAPGDKGLLANAGRCEAVRVERASKSGPDPRTHLLTGETLLAKALAIDPKDRDSWQCLGELRAAYARWKAARSLATQADFTSAREAFDHALAEDPTSQESVLARGQLLAAQAEWEQTQKGNARMALTEGLTQAEALLKARPNWAEALALRAALRVLEAEGSPRASRASKAQEALLDFTEALRWNRHLARHLASWVERAKRMGQG